MTGATSEKKERNIITAGISLPANDGYEAMLRLVDKYREQKWFTEEPSTRIAETCGENPIMLVMMYKYEEDIIKDEYPELAKFYPFD